MAPRQGEVLDPPRAPIHLPPSLNRELPPLPEEVAWARGRSPMSAPAISAFDVAAKLAAAIEEVGVPYAIGDDIAVA